MVAASLLLWPVAAHRLVLPVVGRSCSARCSSSRRTCCCAGARDTDDVVDLQPMRLFHWSNIYLSLLFVAVALDPLLLR